MAWVPHCGDLEERVTKLSPALQAKFDAMSPEARGAIKSWVKMQEEKYGPDWKRIKAEEMAKEIAPTLERLSAVLNSKRKP